MPRGELDPRRGRGRGRVTGPLPLGQSEDGREGLAPRTSTRVRACRRTPARRGAVLEARSRGVGEVAPDAADGDDGLATPMLDAGCRVALIDDFGKFGDSRVDYEVALGTPSCWRIADRFRRLPTGSLEAPTKSVLTFAGKRPRR